MNRLLASAALALGLLSAGCGSVDAALDCQGICERYKECFDKNYDVSACASRCRSNANSDTTYKGKADVCKACIDNASCTGAVFSCSTNCSAVVP